MSRKANDLRGVSIVDDRSISKQLDQRLSKAAEDAANKAALEARRVVHERLQEIKKIPERA
jgi:hypothetical protein